MKAAATNKYPSIFYASLLVIALYAFVSLFFSKETLPIHYDFHLNPTAVGSKYNLLSLPIVNLLINTVLFVAAKNPTKLNVGVGVEEGNEDGYKNIISILNALIILATLSFGAIALVGLRY